MIHRAPAFVLAACACACPARPGTIDPSVERVVEVKGLHSFSLTRAEVEASLASSRLADDRSLSEPDPDWVEAHIDGMIEQRLLFEEARRRGVQTSTAAASAAAKEIAESLSDSFDVHYQSEKILQDSLHRRMLIAAMLDSVIPKAPLSQDELQSAWDRLPESERAQPPMLRALHILVESETEARQLRKALRDGASFRAMAQEHSVAPEAPREGDLGWFDPSEYPPVFSECRTLKVGELSGIVPSTAGYHIFKLLDRRPGRLLELSEMVGQLQASARAERERAFLRGLRDSVEVSIHW